MHPKALQIRDFLWELPDERIAKHPLAQRDASKLLVYENGSMRDKPFRDIPEEIPSTSLLVFNTTRVVRARLFMKRTSGATVEIFCTDSADRSLPFSDLLWKRNEATILAFVGNGKRWAEHEALILPLAIEGKNIELKALRTGQQEDQFVIQLNWNSDQSFGEILEAAGKIPLPPYIDRDEETEDADRYQTIFSSEKGSVAAPTASLHFTNDVLLGLDERKIHRAEVILHVGAGTFKPVKSETMEDHNMHREMIVVKRETIQMLLDHLQNNIVASGTTALRTIESLYWFGRKMVLDPGTFYNELFVSQWEPYENETEVPAVVALRTILEWMREYNKTELKGYTQLLIAPGYQFRIANGLITNFHQPGSTLLLLVAAFVGDDWRKVYDHALANDYRFLSYGDASLLWRNKKRP